MPSPAVTPYGAWRSSISAAHVAAAGISMSALRVADGAVLWVERRPLEGGRGVVVRLGAEGGIAELTPGGFDVRTTVHEYGGGDLAAHRASLFFSNFEDQRLYRQDPGADPVALTPEPPAPRAHRYADADVAPDGATLVCVRERHGAEGVLNELVAIPADGSGPPRIVASGHDFYSSPRIDPEGARLAWIAWSHPNMPWDGTELWVGDLGAQGTVTNATRVAGGPDESIYQPEWSPGGTLHFVSDRSGWWNLYRLRGDGAERLLDLEAEFGSPQWVFGTSHYAFLDEQRIGCVYGRDGLHRLAVLEGDGLRDLDVPYRWSPGPYLRASAGRLLLIGAAPDRPSEVAGIDPESGAVEVLRRSAELDLDPELLSRPRLLAFPTAGGETSRALFYPPTNPDHEGPPGERPPLLVMSHGGPTGQAVAAFNPAVQFWTSRGFAVVDVNYRGSTGYGRAYRLRLNGEWGVADVEDCIHAARHLAEIGEVDGRRLAIRGGSAGGYTTLCALTFHPGVFAAGASYYGVGDAEALARETHKFESRYLDSLIGPYPEAAERYRERSPVHHPERLAAPLILFQGLEDAVVPPSQSEAMARALRDKGIPFAYLAFEGEQHGFRRAETVRRCLEAELYFYSRVFGFEPSDRIEPVPIENADGLPARS